MGYRIKTRQYEEELTGCLSDYFYKISSKIETKDQCKIEVRNQWNPFEDEVRKLQDQEVRKLRKLRKLRKYSPRIDIAVGPFAYGEIRYIEEYNELSEISSQFIDSLLSQFKENSKGFSFSEYIPHDYKELNKKNSNEINENPRCFLAIEIERTGSRKHRLGDIVNACSLGRIGIIIAWDKKVLKSFLAITEYLQFLKEKGKPTYETRNLIIVTKEQFSSILKWQLKSSS
jgi:hypothetical protein